MAVILIATVSTLFPLFHLIPLKEAQQKTADEQFDVYTYVNTLWYSLLSNTDTLAVEVNTLSATLEEGLDVASKRFGHRLGMGSNAAYFVHGTGKIVAVGTDVVSIEFSGGSKAIIEFGPVFGNAIRDGAGLLDISDFSNTQDFNAISAEINRRVETQVLPTLKNIAQPGVSIRFVGGVEVLDSMPESPLFVIPILVELL